MSQYYQVNIPQLEQRVSQTDSLYPDRMTYHVDNLIEQYTKSIWSVFEQQPDGTVLMEMGEDGKLYDMMNLKSVWPDKRYCMHVDSDTTDMWLMIPTRWAMMLEYASTQWLVWPDKPIQQLNTQSSQDKIVS